MEYIKFARRIWSRVLEAKERNVLVRRIVDDLSSQVPYSPTVPGKLKAAHEPTPIFHLGDHVPGCHDRALIVHEKTRASPIVEFALESVPCSDVNDRVANRFKGRIGSRGRPPESTAQQTAAAATEAMAVRTLSAH